MEVKVKKYRSVASANADAKRMAADGWQPQSSAGGGTRFSVTGAAGKVGMGALLGPVGFFASSSRKEQPVSITWVRSDEAAAEEQQRKNDAAAEAMLRRKEQMAALEAKIEAGQRLTFRERMLLPKERQRAAQARYETGIQRAEGQSPGSPS